MNEYEKKVLECHEAFEVAVNQKYSKDLLALRETLISEELEELKKEFKQMSKEIEENGNPSKETTLKMFKELADLQYVLSGTAVSFNIPLTEVFSRVHKSNMSKLVNGKPLKREDGKFLKGPNYNPPILDDLID